MRTSGVFFACMVLTCALNAYARATFPSEFHGEWVPLKADCASPVRLRVAHATVTLVNGKDIQTWGNVGVQVSFFGPDYTGISSVALPDFDREAPFTVYFNADEKKGVTKVTIYTPMAGPLPSKVAFIQAAAKKLAARFPLNDLPLRKC